MDVLACPRCMQSLSNNGDAYHCAHCDLSFPVLDAVPWLWPEPTTAILDWRNRFNRLLSEIEAEATLLTSELETISTTNDRAARYAQALATYPTVLTDVLAPLDVPETIAPEVHLALKTALPDHHVVDSYMQNVFRDWCWGEEENQLVAAHLEEVMSNADADIKSIVVLGSGAGRLALDMHMVLGAEQTLAIDSNPLLCLLASQLTQGEPIKIPEFPRVPKDELVIDQQLRLPSHADKIPHGLTFVCADGLAPPVLPASVDLLITPWFIDVVDASLEQQVQLYADLVKPGGHWLNHGSLYFNKRSAADRLNDEQVQAVTKSAGFSIASASHQFLPYLRNPAERQERQELTYTQLAHRTEAPSKARKLQQHQPEWLRDPDVKVPLYDEFRTQITTTRVQGFIMSLVNGERSIREIAALLEEQRLMPAKEAVGAIAHLLRVMDNERLAAKRER